MDKGQTIARALSNEGYRGDEQWLPALYTGERESSRSIHLHALQRAGHAGKLRADGGARAKSAGVHPRAGPHLSEEGWRNGGDAL